MRFFLFPERINISICEVVACSLCNNLAFHGVPKILNVIQEWPCLHPIILCLEIGPSWPNRFGYIILRLKKKKITSTYLSQQHFRNQ